MADDDNDKAMSRALTQPQAEAVGYDTSKPGGTGNVAGIFDTQSALLGGSAANAEAARNATYTTAQQQIAQQTKGQQQANSTLAASQQQAEQLASQSGVSLKEAYNQLGAQQQSARNAANNEASAIRNSGQVDTSGLAQQRQSAAGLDSMASAGQGPSGVSAAATQTRQQTLAQALASMGAGRGAAQAGAQQGSAMGQAAATGAQTAATAGSASAAENQAYQARRLQALQAAGQTGGAMQTQQQQIAQQALAREQSATGVLGQGDTLATQYQQQMAGTQSATATSQAQLAQLEQQNAAQSIGINTNYAQGEGSDLMAALGYRQQQLSVEDQLRNQGISAANTTAANLKTTGAAADQATQQAKKANEDAVMGAMMTVGAGLA